MFCVTFYHVTGRFEVLLDILQTNCRLLTIRVDLARLGCNGPQDTQQNNQRRHCVEFSTGEGGGVLSGSLIDCLSPPGRFLKCVRWVLLSVTTRPWSTVGVRVINVLRLTAIFNIEVYMFDKKRQLQQWTNIINKQYLIHFTRCKNILNQF